MTWHLNPADFRHNGAQPSASERAPPARQPATPGARAGRICRAGHANLKPYSAVPPPGVTPSIETSYPTLTCHDSKDEEDHRGTAAPSEPQGE